MGRCAHFVYTLSIDGFNWDEENINHLAHHGVTPHEVEEVFGRDPEYVFVFTQDGEKRYRAFGVTASGHYLTIAYMERGETIRPITAWDMTRREKKQYCAEKIR